jgi:hypothetical protein
LVSSLRGWKLDKHLLAEVAPNMFTQLVRKLILGEEYALELNEFNDSR